MQIEEGSSTTSQDYLKKNKKLIENMTEIVLYKM